MKGRKPAIAAAGTFFGLFSFSQVYQLALFPKITPPSERAEERTWVNSSHSWLDRRVCDWFGFCGVAHLNQAGWTNWADSKKEGHDFPPEIDLEEFRQRASNVHPENLKTEERTIGEIPDYVTEYAPYIYLYSGEEFWPCDVDDHLIHTTPHLNYTSLQASSDHPNLSNLNDLNRWGRFVYLQSNDNVEDRPEWLGGKTNIPDVPEDSEPDTDPVDPVPSKDGKYEEDVEGEQEDWFNVGIGDTKEKGGIRPTVTTTSDNAKATKAPEDEFWHSELIRRRKGRKVVGGRSDAPATLIVVDKGDGIVDAFWFFFYSYNLGNTVFNVRFGNHVGDWEHTCVRFQHGVPKAIFFSEHSFGEAYTWDAVEKIGKRPVGFSATGTHAMYATSGVHPYILPGGILHDVTDRGPLWDPTLNLYSYTYDYKNDYLRASNITPKAPIEWFYFIGHWGDKFYPLSDPRQYRFLGQYHYVNGPLGPRFKNLGRQEICQGNEECLLKRTTRGPKRARHAKRYPYVGEGEEMSEEDVRRFVQVEP
ncbi:hypothetical protein B0J11DRAFT_79609 [Dendryphion nanum]|uniref:Vacuolar sorting-associated protein n=1 Tax=Dendryphion nanum TaxID=256645 RepID=A0A9P9DH84_9PLEO|nr:hypothetical protein B0J11DRAFT_79609 [Dendryphion nanum]